MKNNISIYIMASKYAYITLVFGGDRYIPGAVCLAKSLISTNTKYDVICMIDSSVSKSGIDSLKQYFTRILLVPLIYKDVIKKNYKKFNDRYDKWINVSFTKWRCLQLLEYKKVLFLDSDVALLKNIDDLFDLTAPAAVFESSQYKHQAQLSYTYGHMRHGEQVDWDEMNIRLKGNISPPAGILTGGCVLLVPSEKYFCRMLNIICSTPQYGNIKCYSGADEQAIVQTFNDVNWTNISNIYHYRAGGVEPDGVYPKSKIRALHWLSGKPWEHKKEADSYPDIKIWWTIYERKVPKQRIKPKVETQLIDNIPSPKSYLSSK